MTGFKFLTAVLVIAWMVPAQAGDGNMTIVNTPELLMVRGHGPGTHARRIVARELPAETRLRLASVSYEESGVSRFTATVAIGENTIDVEGTAGSEPFRMHWVDLGPGVGVETSFRFGDASFDAFISQAGPDDVVIEDYAGFRSAIERSPGWPAVQEVNHLLRSAAVRSDLAVLASLATFGAGGSAGIDGSPIGNYLDCLRSSCGSCGGCWKTNPWTDCYTCPRQPYVEQLIAGTCYLASTSLCLQHLILPVPISPTER